MEVHSNGLGALDTNKDAEKIVKSEPRDVTLPTSSKIPAGEDSTIFSSENMSAKAECVNNSGGRDSNAVQPATTDSAPATSDVNSAAGTNSKHLKMDVLELGSQLESLQDTEDAVFDDMVILENDMVTAAPAAEDPGHTVGSLQATDIKVEGVCQISVPDASNAPSDVGDDVSTQVNFGDKIEHPSVQAAEPTGTVISNITAVSPAVEKEVAIEKDETTCFEAVHVSPSSKEDGSTVGLDGEEVKPIGTVNADAEDMATNDVLKLKNAPSQVSGSPGDRQEVSDEEIQAIKGQKVVKKFGRKNFEGDVVGFDPETKWFKVVYEDGDEEDLEVWEVKEILASSSTLSSTKKRPSTDGGADESSLSSKTPKKKVQGSSVKDVKSEPKAAGKSPKTPGSEAKGSKSSKKSRSSRKPKSPGKLIQRALKSPAFRTPKDIEAKKREGRVKAGTSTPKSTKGRPTKKMTSETVSRSLDLQTPKLQHVNEKSTAKSSASKAVKSSGTKRKAEQGKSSEKSKRSKNKLTEESGDAIVGKQVKKDFDGTLYDGVVVKYDEKTKFYKVKYADGDQEDLELHEVEPILIQNFDNTEEKDDKPAKLSSLSSLMTADDAARRRKRKH
ncbi:hypothetical protein KP509_34G043200 [Ceratopteris richardii]|uniref:Tudor domain-containing protein n=2 Tax=Ceratopteris richardii TaxID=49495 RepID=A0A8T2QKM5_CERRI|nr:hypothetical protein KP509_34G043200 [Ceratopteris richardii]KAH7284195.1 hypothetical protein KP509_34G043200 [Ceratopteris richardii]KAH7284198.1 hypothetical protein KP509_34G043200 [Ceratopteris richardii]